MIEKEFRELISNLEFSPFEKKEYSNFINSIKNSIENINSKEIKVLENRPFINIDNIIKGEKEIDYLISLEFKNKNFPLKYASILTSNEIFNKFLLNSKGIINSFDLANNRLNINYNNYNINFYFYYKKENIVRDESFTDNLSVMTDNLNKIDAFYSLMNKKYNRFISVLGLIKNYRKELKIENSYNDYLIDSILLAYGLENYVWENNIIDYLKNYCHSINDLLEGKTIILSDETYNTLKVLGTFIPNDNYKVIDISNKQNNLLNNSNNAIKNLKSIKTLLTSKFPKDGKVVNIDVSPQFVIKDKVIEWSFKIIDTGIYNHGGEYDYNLDNYYSSIYKAMLKAFQFIVKNKLGNNILVTVNNNMGFSLDNCFPNQLVKEDMEKLSYENQSRYANVLQYAKDFDLGIEFKITK